MREGVKGLYNGRAFINDHPGSPLGVGYPSGRTFRLDGESHRGAWMRIMRLDPCSYCGGPGGTLDHIEPKSKRARGWGGAHSWNNYASACCRCNSRKSNIDLLSYLLVPDNKG